MATSTLTLYRGSGLKLEENFQIDDIEAYLANLGVIRTVTVDDFQYIKHDLNITIKIQQTQHYLDGSLSYTYDYVKIVNHINALQDEMAYYYYITNKYWIAETTLVLELEQDVLNTWTGKYAFTDRTRINRQHKDRLQKRTVSGTQYIARKIDNNSEGFDAQLSHDETDDVTITDELDTSWNLVYRNRQNPTEEDPNPPVDLCAYPDVATTLLVHGGLDNITPQVLSTGIYYYLTQREFCSGSNPNPAYYISYVDTATTKTIPIGSVTWYGRDSGDRMRAENGSFAIMYLANGKITLEYVSFTRRSQTYRKTVTKYEGLDTVKLISNNDILYYYYTSKNYYFYDFVNYGTEVFQVSADYKKVLKSIDEVDRTASDIIKIIKVPYFPAVVRLSNDSVQLDAPEWSYDQINSCLRFWLLEHKMNKTDDYTNQFNPYAELIVDEVPYSNKELPREQQFESKLFHSDFYQPKFVYDSFGFAFNLNDMDIDSYLRDQKFEIDYTVTSTMNSRFLFKFPQYRCVRANQDYNNILSINRNNEVTIYNSEYLNYIRNGYNYDKKNRNLGLVNSAVSIGKGIVGGLITGNPAGVVTGAVSGAISGITSMINANNNIQEKLQSTQNQAVSVSGSDDLDLLEAYSGNRAKMVTYKCSDAIRTMLYDLFHYYGYACNEYGVPKTNTRYWFNFVQCDADIVRTYNIDNRYLDAIKQKYADGVTVFHKHLVDGAVEWNLTQDYENWEVSLDE